MPHLVQLDHDGPALRLGFLGVDFGEALDPSLHRGRRHAEQLGGAVHRQPAQVQQHRLDLDPQRHPARRGVGEVQPARLAAVALLAAHEAVLDVPLSPTTLAPQRHPVTPSATPSPMDMGNLCGVETLIRETGDSREMEMMRWGLIPHWAKNAKIGGRMINARAETVREKPAFKHAYAARRLIVPASGFYEWQREGTHKRPFAIHRADGAPLAFAGLWETWHDIDTFTIITTTAIDTMGQVHERMPLILSPRYYDRWLDPENDDPVEVLGSVPAVALELTPLSDWVN